MSDMRAFTPRGSGPDLADLLAGGELCALCASQGTGCCRTEREFAHLSFPLSAPEWRRIVPYADRAADEFADEHAPAVLEQAGSSGPANSARKLLPAVEDSVAPPADGDLVCSVEMNTKEFLQAMLSLFPRKRETLARLFPEGKRHLRMRLRQDGACVFLGADGCRLPRAVRPWYCLLFPAWMHGGGIALFQAEGCLISRRAVSPEHGLELLDMTRERTRKLYSALCNDWGLSSRGNG